jgi:hypothetical protein
VQPGAMLDVGGPAILKLQVTLHSGDEAGGAWFGDAVAPCIGEHAHGWEHEWPVPEVSWSELLRHVHLQGKVKSLPIADSFDSCSWCKSIIVVEILYYVEVTRFIWPPAFVQVGELHAILSILNKVDWFRGNQARQS